MRPQDEAYWKEYRTTPKAFLFYERARDLWATRYGTLTGLLAVLQEQDPEALAEALRKQLQQRVTPVSQGLILTPARRLALDASRGATDFGEYFTYFSFFIVVAALLLVVLFFRLGIEQRLRQIGVCVRPDTPGVIFAGCSRLKRRCSRSQAGSQDRRSRRLCERRRLRTGRRGGLQSGRRCSSCT